MTATMRGMGRPRGALDAAREKRLRRLAEKSRGINAEMKAEALQALADGGSFAWVNEVTGISTSTLQSWKKEAGA